MNEKQFKTLMKKLDSMHDTLFFLLVMAGFLFGILCYFITFKQ